MSHFKHFPKVLYNFGNEISPVIFQKLGTYVDIIDQVRDDITIYADYTVLDNDRPDIYHIIYMEIYNTIG